MEQHPVPQQISSYQFRLVGDMTLKQFIELAGGVLVGVIIYATGLPGFIKWPIIVISVLIGAALAFLPLEERPLEQWVFAFFRSVYSPTVYRWTEQHVSYFQPEPNSQSQPQVVQSQTGEVHVTGTSGTVLSLEETEKSLLSKFSGLFHATPAARVAPPQTAQHVQANTPPQIKVPPIPQPKTVFSNEPTRVAVTAGVAGPLVETQKPTVPAQDVVLQQVGQTLEGQRAQAGVAAQFSPQAAPPNPPEQPNLVVGQIMGPTGEIVDKAILEIRDDQGRPVRALRSNQVGHFMIVTPLVNGKYEIVPEKPGFKFEPIIFEAQGKIIPPIAIKATAKETTQEGGPGDQNL